MLKKTDVGSMLQKTRNQFFPTRAPYDCTRSCSRAFEGECWPTLVAVEGNFRAAGRANASASLEFTKWSSGKPPPSTNPNHQGVVLTETDQRVPRSQTGLAKRDRAWRLPGTLSSRSSIMRLASRKICLKELAPSHLEENLLDPKRFHGFHGVISELLL